MAGRRRSVETADRYATIDELRRACRCRRSGGDRERPETRTRRRSRAFPNVSADGPAWTMGASLALDRVRMLPQWMKAVYLSCWSIGLR